MNYKDAAGNVLRLGLIVILATLSAIAQPAAETTGLPQTHPVTLPRAEYFDLRSKSGIDYRIFVSGPKGEVHHTGVPVIYLSDGNGNFPLLLAAAQRQIRDELPCVVVGIGYATEDRQHIRQLRSVDLTPPTSAEWLKTKAGPFGDLKTGGQDQFLDFIEKELKPAIERKFKIDRQRQTLFGHSFGGLFVLHVLFTHPERFQTYVAVSPSIWWNEGSILKEEQQFLERLHGHPLQARLLLMVGELEQPTGAALTQPPQRRGPPGRAVDSVKEMTQRLSGAKIEGFTIQSHVLVEEHHGSVVLPAASRGVRFALGDQPPRTP